MATIGRESWCFRKIESGRSCSHDSRFAVDKFIHYSCALIIAMDNIIHYSCPLIIAMDNIMLFMCTDNCYGQYHVIHVH